MKVNDFEIKNIIIYDAEREQLIKPCRFEGVYNTRTITGEKTPTKDNYPALLIEDLKKVNCNQIKTSKAKQYNFVVLDRESSTEYSKYYLLYLNRSIIGEIETKEERKEYQKGRISVIYNTFIYFKFNYVKNHDRKINFVKTDADALALTHNYDNIKDISELIQERKEMKSYFKDNEEKQRNRQKTIDFLEMRKNDGFKYLVWVWGYEWSNCLKCCGYVDHYDKTDDFKELEEITKVINSCVYSSNKLSSYEVARMMEKLTIKKR